jgi:hypothetical protein
VIAHEGDGVGDGIRGNHDDHGLAAGLEEGLERPPEQGTACKAAKLLERVRGSAPPPTSGGEDRRRAVLR